MSIVALSMVFGPHNLLPDREQRMFARILQGLYFSMRLTRELVPTLAYDLVMTDEYTPDPWIGFCGEQSALCKSQRLTHIAIVGRAKDISVHFFVQSTRK